MTHSPNLLMLLSVLKFNAKMTRSLDRTLNVHGLSLTEWLVLHHLMAQDGRCLARAELADVVDLTPSGVTRLLGPMEKLGMVEKQSHARDARKSMVRVTQAGQVLYLDGLRSVEAKLTVLFDGLGSKQVYTLMTLAASLIKQS